jgi:branched-chain amino acid aminotransferase
VGPYYATGLAPVSIMIEEDDVRAVRGGTGFTKCGGNYAASLRAGEKAEEKGFSQVLWLDGVERKYIEEVGAMNIFFKIAGKVVTPALNGSILPGITRDSVIQVCKDWGYEVEERRISIEEVYNAAENGTLNEMFGTGTAAVISPVGELNWDGKKVVINNNEIGAISQMLYDDITGIQYGKKDDPFGWSMVL